MIRLEPWDDRLHLPGPSHDWRESFYFDFQDDLGWAGLIYLSVSPHEGAVQRVVILLQPGGDTLVCLQREPLTLIADPVLEHGMVQLHCQEPLRRWRLIAGGVFLSLPSGEELSAALTRARSSNGLARLIPVAFDLQFEAAMPAYRFPTGAWDYLGPGQQHFEQLGQVSGWLRVADKDILVYGTSARDRTWGIRDWLHAEWWHRLNLRFADLYIVASLRRVGGRESSSGFLYRDGRLLPIARVRLEAERDPLDLHLRAGRCDVVTEQGDTLTVELTPHAFCHTVVAHQGAWQNHDNVTRVTCRCEGRAGHGFWEYNQREAFNPMQAGVLFTTPGDRVLERPGRTAAQRGALA
jgi:hypothetical protein